MSAETLAKPFKLMKDHSKYAKIMDETNHAEGFTAQRKAASIKHASTRFCLNCGEQLAHHQRWCNSDCRDDGDALQRNKKEASWKAA